MSREPSSGSKEVFDILHFGFRDKFEELHQAVLTLKAALGASFHHLPPNPEGSGIVTRIVDEIGNLSVALKAFRTAYHKLTELTTMIDDVKQRIETLDDPFLQQGNSREWKTEHLRRRVR